MKKWYKKCPFCSNEIKEWAIKCQFCKEFLEWSTNEDESKVKKINLDNKKVSQDKNKKEIKEEWIIVDLTAEEKELKKAENNMNTAFIFWCICAGISAFMVLVKWDYSLILWVIYFWVLLYFLRKKKSRIAALFLFVEYTLDIIYSLVSWWKIWLLWLLLLAWLFMWIIWSFSYHKIKGTTKFTNTDIVLIIVCSIITLFVLVWIFLA